MTLREILANRARRHSRIAESKKRTSARERRRINHLIESRENLRRRNHYILVEDENEDELVEIEPDDTGTDTTGAEGEDMSKDEIVNTFKTLAAELGLKVIPDDAEGDEGDDAEGDEGAEGDEPAESTDAQPAAPATDAQPADQNAQPTNEADDKDDEAADAPADAQADAPADGTVDAGEGDAPADDAEGDDVPADDEKKEEDVGEIAKKMAEMTRDDWEGLLAQVL